MVLYIVRIVFCIIFLIHILRFYKDAIYSDVVFSMIKMMVNFKIIKIFIIYYNIQDIRLDICIKDKNLAILKVGKIVRVYHFLIHVELFSFYIFYIYLFIYVKENNFCIKNIVNKNQINSNSEIVTIKNIDFCYVNFRYKVNVIFFERLKVFIAIY